MDDTDIKMGLLVNVCVTKALLCFSSTFFSINSLTRAGVSPISSINLWLDFLAESSIVVWIKLRAAKGLKDQQQRG